MKILTGRTGTNHITAADDGARYAGTFGSGDYVLDIGSKFLLAILGNNVISVSDGEIMMQGRHGRILPGADETFLIAPASAVMSRIDLLICEYRSGEFESMTLKIVEGTPSQSDPEEPTLITGNIRNGDSIHQMVLYAIFVDGSSISSTQQRFSVIPTIYSLQQDVNTKATGNKVTSIDSSASDDQIPSARAVYEALSGLTPSAGWEDITNKPDTFPPSEHNHDARYYTEVEIGNLLNNKAGVSHTHDDRYYTETEIDTKINGKLWERGYIGTPTDLNDVLDYGVYTCGDSSLLTNRPAGAGYGNLIVLVSRSYTTQLYLEIVNMNGPFSVIYQRMRAHNGLWTEWTPWNRNKRKSRSAEEHVCYGYITSGSTELHLCIPLRYGAYYGDGETAPSLTTITGSIRLSSGGYVGGSGYNFLTSGATINCSYSPNGLKIVAFMAGGWKTGGSTGTTLTNNSVVCGNIVIAGTY